ncbi:MAG TPA: transporter [Kofleriaceae bacterium]|nr:transporter [Kofleriaceae bacterium]
MTMGRAVTCRALALAAMALGGAGRARADDHEPRNFSVERFHLAADRNGLFDVEWAEHPGGEVIGDAIDAACVVGLMDNPLVVSRLDGNQRMVVGALVGTRATADLVGSIALRKDLSIGADLPVVMYQDRASIHRGALDGLESMSRFGIGNLRVTPKLTLATEDSLGAGVAILAPITLPTESAGDAYLGDHGLSIAPTLAVSRRIDAWRGAVNVGYLARQQASLLDLTVDDEVFARAGVGYNVPALRSVSVDLTLSAATRATDFGGRNSSNLEMLLGGTVQIDPQLQVFGGVGAGLTHGFGTPDARVMVGVRLTRGAGGHASHRPHGPAPDRSRDSDGDGVPDDTDTCPYEAGIAALEGCPDGDDDQDGIPYGIDQCPSAPEDVDGFEDSDGCPDPDNDNDGVLDEADQCPQEAGPASNHGCPIRSAPPEAPERPPGLRLEPAKLPPGIRPEDAGTPPAERPTDAPADAPADAATKAPAEAPTDDASSELPGELPPPEPPTDLDPMIER